MRKKGPPYKLDRLISTITDWGFSWGGLRNNKNGEWWLISQLIIISAHLYPPWPKLIEIGIKIPVIINFLGALLFITGVIISIYAFISLGSNLSPLPQPKNNARLITHGSYKNCRHPLYQGLIIISFSITVFCGSILHLFLLCLLSFILVNKAKVEEKRLKKIYPEYKEYQVNTPAIINKLLFFDWRS